jgi:hypothetical protein
MPSALPHTKSDAEIFVVVKKSGNSSGGCPHDDQTGGCWFPLKRPLMESHLKELKGKMRKRADFSPLQDIVKKDYAIDHLDIIFAKLYKLKKKNHFIVNKFQAFKLHLTF